LTIFRVSAAAYAQERLKLNFGAVLSDFYEVNVTSDKLFHQIMSIKFNEKN
jgi:hypothetical protein